jgi:hypothetical protein
MHRQIVLRKIAWITPGGERTALKNRPKVLIMINHGPVGVVRKGRFGVLIGPKSGASKA